MEEAKRRLRPTPALVRAADAAAHLQAVRRPERKAFMALELDDHDKALTETARAAIRDAVGKARVPMAVVKRIVAEAMKHRNHGRDAAIRRRPFKGVCEASGAPLERVDAVLDELEPERGYEGAVRWVCPKANGSGKRSCGVC